MFIIRYERKTQPMKKILSLSPILLTLSWIIVLSACVCSTTNEKSDESHTIKDGETYQNVKCSFDFDSHCYKVLVYEKEKTYNVPPKNYYSIELESYFRNDNNETILNEFFVSTNELFVYYVK